VYYKSIEKENYIIKKNFECLEKKKLEMQIANKMLDMASSTVQNIID